MIGIRLLKYSKAVLDHEILDQVLKGIHIKLPLGGAGDRLRNHFLASCNEVRVVETILAVM